jgi:hypothetical protein
MPSTTSTPITTGTPTTTSPPTTLVDHWSAEVDAFAKRKSDAEKAKVTVDENLAQAKTALAAEDKAVTDLTKDVASTRAALAKADLVEVEALSKELSALIVRQHDSEGRRLEAARKLDEAQVEADVAADQLSDAAAGLGEANGKLTAAKAAEQKRDGLVASKDKPPFKDAVARARTEGADLLTKAKARIAVIPQALRGEAKNRFDAEVAGLKKRGEEAEAAEDAAATEDATSEGVDAAVAAKRRAFGRAEDKLRTWLDSIVADVAQAIAALAKVAGKEGDPPLLSDKEREKIERASGGTASAATPLAPPTELVEPIEPPTDYEQGPSPDSRSGEEAQAEQDAWQTVSATRPARAYQPIESPTPGAEGRVTAQQLIELGRTAYEKARAYHELLAKKQAAKPGTDAEVDPEVKAARTACDNAVEAYAEAVKTFQAPPAAYVPDKAWQAVLDVWTAERRLVRAQDAGALALLVDALKPDKPEKAEVQLVQALGRAAAHRRTAEDLKYEARRRAKLLEKAESSHPARLFARVRGDF